MKSISIPNETTATSVFSYVHPAWERITLLIILFYEAAGALLGGTLLILAPDGHYMKMPVEIMRGTFENFLIPGIILFGLGLLTTVAFFRVLRKAPGDWLLAGFALGGFLIWFTVEIMVLGGGHWLHIMWGVPVLLATILCIHLYAIRESNFEARQILIYCGILSSLWYVSINIYVAAQYPGYSMSSFTVSELSAIGAPTRMLWMLLAVWYPLLFSALGWAAVELAQARTSLRSAGYLIVAYCAFNLYWPPMHMRGVETSSTDMLHITWAIITNFVMWIIMTLAAIALNRKFRIFTITAIMLHMVFGLLAFSEAANISTNGPTPFIGLWERINILIFMLWVVFFGMALWKVNRAATVAR